MDAEHEKRARGIALQNALEHGGATKSGLIISKLLGEMPELRSQAAELGKKVATIVESVNAMSESAQRAELESDHPKRLEVSKPKNIEGLPPLQGAQDGKVVTRFPPEPNGYPHIGHAKAAIINDEYAKMYKGRCVLRLDDTNPEAERLEYYAAIKVGLEWLGIEFATVKNTSDDMKEILNRGRTLIQAGGAYVCTCKSEDISKGRRAMIACPCSSKGGEDHTDRWEKMHSKYSPGQAIVRFRGDMSSQNTTMRDPALFRIIHSSHPLVGDEYKVWPTYDFAVAIEDSLDGVTHAFRSKEYELRAELYSSILDALHMRKPSMDVFSRLAFDGMPVSKRVIRPLIESGAVSWYDDPRLPTLEAMRRRGIRPKAIRQFVLSLGFTKSDTLAPFATLESRNRKLVDTTSPRLHMVTDFLEIRVEGLDVDHVMMQSHPTASMGERKIGLGGGTLLVQKADAQAKSLWLLGVGNINLVNEGGIMRGKYVDNDLGSGNPRVQWVPKEGSPEITILVPKPLFKEGQYDPQSLIEQKARVEPHWSSLDDDTIVQFVRYGYCRKDSNTQAVFTHK